MRSSLNHVYRYRGPESGLVKTAKNNLLSAMIPRIVGTGARRDKWSSTPGPASPTPWPYQPVVLTTSYLLTVHSDFSHGLINHGEIIILYHFHSSYSSLTMCCCVFCHNSWWRSMDWNIQLRACTFWVWSGFIDLLHQAQCNSVFVGILLHSPINVIKFYVSYKTELTLRLVSCS